MTKIAVTYDEGANGPIYLFAGRVHIHNGLVCHRCIISAPF